MSKHLSLALIVTGRRAAGDGTGRARRISADVPLSAIAERCGVTAGAVHRWETGRARPRGVHAALYAEALSELESVAS